MTEQEKEIPQYPKRIMASYGARELFGQWVAAAFGFSVFFFYENVIGLSSAIAALAFVLYSIWNAINDPITGWMIEKIHPRMPWNKKGFKRFPWIIIGAFPFLISYLLIYLVPSNWYGSPEIVVEHQWAIFGWEVGTLCLYDTCITVYDVNVVSLYPDKFRGLNERRTVQGFGTILGIIGLVLAAIIPPMFIKTFDPATYVNAALVTVGFGFIIFLFILPGVYEDRRVRNMYEQRIKSGIKLEVPPFIKSTKEVLKEKRFILKIIHFFGYQVGGVMIQTSAFYVTTYILYEEASAITFLLGAMLLGALISVPLWTILANRIKNNRLIGIISCFLLFATFLPLIFVSTLIGWIISLIFFGIGIGANWYIDPPLMGDVLDDISVRTGKTQYSIFYGFQSFIIKFGQTFIAVTIALSHIFTGFVEGSPTQTPLAVFGIRIHTAIVPAILMLITGLIFWKYFDLTPEKVAENRKKLKAMELENQ